MKMKGSEHLLLLKLSVRVVANASHLKELKNLVVELYSGHLERLAKHVLEGLRWKLGNLKKSLE
jgi:hypothetical protein